MAESADLEQYLLTPVTSCDTCQAAARSPSFASNRSHNHALLLPAADAFDVINRPSVAAIFSVVYSIVIVFGISGSTLVLVTIAKTPSLRTATNVFIANLAFSDILICVFDLPLTLYYRITQNWVFGSILCRIIPAVFGVLACTCTLALMLIAVDRYILIVCPLSRKMSIQMAVVLLVLSGIVSASMAIPIAVFSKYEVLSFPFPWGESTKGLCGEEWPNYISRRVYTVLAPLIQFFIPMLISGILYLGIFERLRTRVVMSQHNGASSHGRSRTTRMLLAVIIYFALTWMPYHVYFITSEFHPLLLAGRYLTVVDLSLRIVALSSACVNPILYGWLNMTYRTAFFELLGHRPGGARDNVSRRSPRLLVAEQNPCSHTEMVHTTST